MTRKLVYGTITSIAFVVASLTIPTVFHQEASAGPLPTVCSGLITKITDPLEVNVVQYTKKDHFRTLVVEKESFDCDQSETNIFVRDLTIIIDKIENKFGNDIGTSIRVLQCDKTVFESSGLPLPPPMPKCSLQTFSDTLSSEIVGCDQTPETFVEVGDASFPTTVGGNPNHVNKFVIVEKEILLCFTSGASTPDRILEVFNLEELVNTNPTITQHTIICEKEIQTGIVLACQDFGITTIT